ncbi:DUF368 domain-containing protein [Tannockella kyphosi]|uniref:DUF368 domain-containing protein n=1 Tax=Tannockella kyphosi TaxID=2899121 RepID=UPI002011DEF8|nr:DUF368 domain-containing protein [Tannockella kyphosi]
MLKVLIGGIAVGMANIIPGVSGGTMMVVLGIFNQVMDSISGLFSTKETNRKQHVMFLCFLGLGACIGLVVFANVLEFLFGKFPDQTMYCFVGMVACSIPSLIKKEMSGDKFEAIPFFIGFVVIFGISYFAPEKMDTVITEFPPISIIYILTMIFIGMIAGGAMFVPGVSGSMILLIIGKYYLFKSLLANVTSFEIDILVPLAFMMIGILLGIVLSSKVTGHFLKTNHSTTMNFVLGLVVASSIVLIPFSATYDMYLIVTSVIAVVIGGVIVLLLEKIA